MITDSLLLMSNQQAVTSTAASTDVIDQLAKGDAIRPGARLQIITRVACTDTGSDATVNFALQDSADNSSFADVLTTGALAFAVYSPAKTIVADWHLPIGLRRYLRVNYTVASGPLTAGAFDARIVLGTTRTLDKSL